MPGTYVVSTQETFSTALLMSSAKKEKFGSPGEYETNADGVLKWAVQLAVTFTSTNGIAPVSEVLTVSVISATDPAAGIAVGSPVILTGLRVGIMAPERRGEKIIGGKVWHSATGVQRVDGQLRPVKGEQQAS
ncbi:MAG: hypothetical protein JOZ77_13285 [Candidatus Eremiobacteraeota bacterium]|nr:hypothetical protein [Candidatus Eremiobacteraeota bacterium]